MSIKFPLNKTDENRLGNKLLHCMTPSRIFYLIVFELNDDPRRYGRGRPYLLFGDPSFSIVHISP